MNNDQIQHNAYYICGTVIISCYVSLSLLCHIARCRVFHMEVSPVYYIVPILTGILSGVILIVFTGTLRTVWKKKVGQLIWLDLSIYAICAIVCYIWLQMGQYDSRIVDYAILLLIIVDLLLIIDFVYQVSNEVVQLVVCSSILFINGLLIEELSSKITIALLIVLAKGVMWCFCNGIFRRLEKSAWRWILGVVISTVLVMVLLIWVTGHLDKLRYIGTEAGAVLWNSYMKTGEMPVVLENGNYVLTWISEGLGIWGIAVAGIVFVTISVLAGRMILQFIHMDLKQSAAMTFGLYGLFASVLLLQVLAEAGILVSPYIHWQDMRIGIPLCTFACGTLFAEPD